MKARNILGHIDCPACGTAKGVRVTPDKNGEPFGYCEATCGLQLRIGGDPDRVRRFVARYPWADPQAAAPSPVTATAPSPAPTTKPAKAPAPAPAQAPAPKPRGGLDEALRFLGGMKA